MRARTLFALQTILHFVQNCDGVGAKLLASIFSKSRFFRLHLLLLKSCRFFGIEYKRSRIKFARCWRALYMLLFFIIIVFFLLVCQYNCHSLSLKSYFLFLIFNKKSLAIIRGLEYNLYIIYYIQFLKRCRHVKLYFGKGSG